MNEEIIKRAEVILANRTIKEQGYCVLALIDTDARKIMLTSAGFETEAHLTMLILSEPGRFGRIKNV